MYNKLYHHGIKGQRWGIRRFQNEDGSLTPEGEKRYNDSLSKLYDTDNEDDDYRVSKGISLFRRNPTDVDDENEAGKKYTYTYDYDSDDDNFYQQFGRKINEYGLADDALFAGRKSLGKAFVDKMLNLDDENDIDAMDTLYSDLVDRHKYEKGEKFCEDLFQMPYEPNKHLDTLEKIGAEMVSRMLSSQRHESTDNKLKKKGFRDIDTAANDIGLDILNKLVEDGYSGMRDYNDYGSAAGVNTPTVIFDPDKTLRKIKQWMG